MATLRTTPAGHGGPVYAFAADEPLRIKNAQSANPQIIGAALTEIAAANNGHLTPGDTVDAARDQNHPLHPFFEWDDRVAAEGYREDQARHLIRIIRVVDDNRDEPPRAFLSVREQGSGGISYRSLQEVTGSLELQMSVLSSAERDLQAFERRYRALADICDLVKEARERLRARRDALPARTEARVQ